jgi:tRNA nucleotidyltransferase (CCA-adding enzyme)
MLLHDVAKPEAKTIDENGVAHFKMHDVQGAEVAKQILRRLKFDNETLHTVVKLVQYHDYRMPAKAQNVRRAMNKIGVELFPLYMEVRMADTLAQSAYLREEKLENLQAVQECYEEIVEKGECVSLKMLALTGSDLIATGMEPGKAIGELLNRMLEYVIEHPECNTKEELLKLKKSWEA